MVDLCVSCGAIVPEGRMICPSCESKNTKEAIKINCTHMKKILEVRRWRK